MRYVSILILALLSSFVSAYAQQISMPEINRPVHTVVLGQPVEIVPTKGSDAANFVTVSVTYGGKTLRQFAAEDVTFPQILASYGGDYTDNYLLYRTSMGNGACGGGSLYIIKFGYKSEGQSPQVDVTVSPVLTTCLGEFPSVKFDTAANEGFIISVSGYKINTEYMVRWESERTARPTAKARKARK